jgi:uncharacterized damage-inducible protein DinB
MRLGLPLLATALLVVPAAHARIIKPPVAPKNGVRAELLRDLDDMEKKVMQLATAVPGTKYSWRPARGVRSVSEVYMHMAGGNYAAVAAVAPKSAPYDAQNLEQITDKERVLDELRKSFEQLRGVFLAAGDADLEKPVRMYNDTMSERAVFMTALNHLHEHLGQSIAYARINGVVPPWSGM